MIDNQEEFQSLLENSFEMNDVSESDQKLIVEEAVLSFLENFLSSIEERADSLPPDSMTLSRLLDQSKGFGFAP